MKASALLAVAAATTMLAGCQTSKTGGIEKASASTIAMRAPTHVEGAPIIGNDDFLAKGLPPLDYATFSRRARTGKYATTQVDKIRHEVLRDAATAYASQAGYYRRAYDIMRQLEVDGGRLSNAFNFNRVVYATQKEAGFVVPPIVTRGTSALQINDSGTKSVAADEYYRIEEPGRIVGVVPTWRDYLVLALEQPNEPDVEFLPQDDEERKIFDAYLAEGWKVGEGMADDALKAAMNDLRRDYLGMVEYRRLVDAGLIKELAVRWDEKRSAAAPNELFIGERTIRIVDAATFVRDPKQWKPVMRKLDGK